MQSQLMIILSLLTVLMTGCSGGDSAKSTVLSPGFLTNGPVNDSGYNSSHNQARQYVDQALGSQVKTTIVENIPESADAERTMERLISNGSNVVVGTSFGYQDSTIASAKRHPNVRYLQAWGFKYAPNVASYSVKMYEAWYLAGIVAGRMTKTNKLGIVAAHPIPPMKWQISAYVIGAQSVNPKVTATVTFINHWFDPVLSSQAADALVNQGHDVLCGVLDNSVGVAQAAERRGVWLIGHNTDLSSFAPTKILVGTRWIWGKLYEDQFRRMIDGTWTGGSDGNGGLKEGYVGLTDFSNSVPANVRAEVTAARDKIINGQLIVYSGPLRDNTGKERVPAGQNLTHEEVMALDWLVDGVK